MDIETPNTDERWNFEKDKEKVKIFSGQSNFAYFIIGGVIIGGMVLTLFKKK